MTLELRTRNPRYGIDIYNRLFNNWKQLLSSKFHNVPATGLQIKGAMV